MSKYFIKCCDTCSRSVKTYDTLCEKCIDTPYNLPYWYQNGVDEPWNDQAAYNRSSIDTLKGLSDNLFRPDYFIAGKEDILERLEEIKKQLKQTDPVTDVTVYKQLLKELEFLQNLNKNEKTI